MRARQAGLRVLVAFLPCAVIACSSVPPAIASFANDDLPKRNARDYATLLPELRAELVHRDSAAACSVALEEGKKEAEAPACACTHSSQADWQQKCQPWFSTVGGSAGAPASVDAGTGG